MKKIALIIYAVLCVASTGLAKPRGQPPNLIYCQNDCGTVDCTMRNRPCLAPPVLVNG
jgi:hypothetical protein